MTHPFQATCRSSATNIATNRSASTNTKKFEAGGITIVDLSYPFVDVNTACSLFNICMGIYLESNSRTSKIIAVDEAHKVNFAHLFYLTSPSFFYDIYLPATDRTLYITDNPASKALVGSLLAVIRQRHYGVRVFILT